MNTGYTKLFCEIVASTIWNEPNATRIVWITMLALADQNGNVSASIPGLAILARVTTEECRSAISCLESPDSDSRSKEFDGRRIEPIDGGWLILNHAKYRFKMSLDDRKEYQRKYWQKRKLNQNSTETQQNSTESIQAEAEAEAEADKKEEKRPTRKVKPLDDEWLKEVKSKYSWLDFDKEMSKMQGWLLSPKGANRKMTRQFVINWLNRCDQPVSGTFQPQTSNRGKI